MARVTANNFDTSSTGTNIEFTGFWDGDKSRQDFEESIQVIAATMNHSIGYYKDCGNVPDADEVTFTARGTCKAMREYLATAIGHMTRAELKQLKKADLAGAIIDAQDMTQRDMLIAWATDKLPNLDGIEIEPSKALTVIKTTGYSQGDYARVIYCADDLEAAWGSKPKQASIQKTVDHLYWDSPVYATFKIDGEEYSYWDQPSYDEYEWDKAAFIKWVSKQSKIPAKKLAPLAPENLEYL